MRETHREGERERERKRERRSARTSNKSMFNTKALFLIPLFIV